MFTKAICRLPDTNFADGLTSAELGIPDYEKTLEQHQVYQRVLASCGLMVNVLPANYNYPDSTFVEDTAVIYKDLAIFTRPGAESRLGEVELIRPEVESFFKRTVEIVSPGTLDGGDICEAGNHFFIGISNRTNQEGANQLAEILANEGCTSVCVDIRETPGLLHLKSGLAFLNNNTLVLASALAEHPAFKTYECIVADPSEQYAANCILVNDKVLMPSGYPHLEKKVREAGYSIELLDMSEYQKMDGGLSCLSLRFS